MFFQPIKPGLYQLTHNGVNVFLVDCCGLTLIDTGTPQMGPMIVRALDALGHQPSSLARILLTHAHPDHAGSASFLRQELGAEVFCHPAEAELLRSGEVVRECFKPSPGLLNRLLYRIFISGNPTTIAPLDIDVELPDGVEIVSDIKAVHTPGHSPGHLAFFWRDTLIAGDAVSHVGWLKAAIGNEDYDLALHSIQKLCRFDFQTACFGHGAPIIRRAAQRFRFRRWSEKD